MKENLNIVEYISGTNIPVLSTHSKPNHNRLMPIPTMKPHLGVFALLIPGMLSHFGADRKC